MLTNTFRHIPKIGPTTERRFWEAGALSWQEALEMPSELLPTRLPVDEYLHLSLEMLTDRNARWFGDHLPNMESWRLFPEFRTEVAYIDIETDGGSVENGVITTIALWDGQQLRHYVHGENLRDFQDDILEYSLLVTWNGAAFDIPYIEHWFQTSLPHAHIDLRHIMASLGFRGGLKKVEREFEIDRGALDGVDGYFAVLLWRAYTNEGDQGALQTLLAYNSLDVINLERLMVEAYNRKIEETPFALANELPLPSFPEKIDIEPDEGALERIRQKLSAKEDYLRGLARHLLSGS